jgi:desulfoferrodoxin (superoxide reductase-like protein)
LGFFPVATYNARDLSAESGLRLANGATRTFMERCTIMMTRRSIFLSIVFSFLILQFTSHALANKAAVTIQAPASAAKGSEITIRVTVTHNANNFLHYTEWVSVMVNNQEVARWNYTGGKRPDGEVFTKEVQYTLNGDAEISAQASCNLHGSEGPATAKVLITQ